MMSEESVEVNAPSADEAIILGLTRLGATRDEVEIEILDEGSRGFLGLGFREARVRVTRRTKAPEASAPAEPKDIPEEVATAPEVEVAEPETSPTLNNASEEPVISPEVEKSVSEATDEPAVVVTEPDTKKDENAGRVRAREATPSKADDRFDRGLVEEVSSDVIEHLLPDLQMQMTMDWRQEDRPTLWLSIRGRDSDSLVGPRAQTLDAIQYLVRTLVHHKVEGNYNLVVDADGYRRRRRRSLEALAHRMADQADRTGRRVRLRPMPANERRVIHMTLRKDNRVKTESFGTGRHRAITVIPQKSRRED